MIRAQKGEGFPGQQIVVLPKSVVANALRQPLLSELLPTDVGFFPRAAGHLRERVVGVDQAVFIYCTKGVGWCELVGQRRSVGAGELLVIRPNASHVYGADDKDPWSIFWLHATGAQMNALLAEFDISIEIPTVLLGQNPQIVTLFEELINILEHGYTPSHLLYASRALMHLIGLMIWQRQQRWQSNPKPSQNMAQSIAYMRQHLHQPLKVSHLAAMLNLSVSHYSALFKRQTGYAPMDYFIRLRMHQACQLLDTTEMSIKEVAAALGYDDPFYFSRIFKVLNDVSPTNYRMLHKG